jgi:hypothetical protein
VHLLTLKREKQLKRYSSSFLKELISEMFLGLRCSDPTLKFTFIYIKIPILSLFKEFANDLAFSILREVDKNSGKTKTPSYLKTFILDSKNTDPLYRKILFLVFIN